MERDTDDEAIRHFARFGFVYLVHRETGDVMPVPVEQYQVLSQPFLRNYTTRLTPRDAQKVADTIRAAARGRN